MPCNGIAVLRVKTKADLKRLLGDRSAAEAVAELLRTRGMEAELSFFQAGREILLRVQGAPVTVSSQGVTGYRWVAEEVMRACEEVASLLHQEAVAAAIESEAAVLKKEWVSGPYRLDGPGVGSYLILQVEL